MRQDLDGELVALSEGLLGRPTQTNTSRSSRDNDSSRREGGALRQEADQLGDAEDQVTGDALVVAQCGVNESLA